MLYTSAATQTPSETHLALTFVVVGVNSNSTCSIVISVTCSADHYNMVSDSLVILRPAKTFHMDETRSVFPNLSCRKIVHGMYCVCQSSPIGNLGFKHDHFLSKLWDCLFNRQRHPSRIDSGSNLTTWGKATANSTPDAKPMFLVLLLRHTCCGTSSCVFPRREVFVLLHFTPATLQLISQAQLSTHRTPCEQQSGKQRQPSLRYHD